MVRGIKFGTKCMDTQRQLDLQPHSPSWQTYKYFVKNCFCKTDIYITVSDLIFTTTISIFILWYSGKLIQLCILNTIGFYSKKRFNTPTREEHNQVLGFKQTVTLTTLLLLQPVLL